MNIPVVELYNGFEIPNLFYGTYKVLDEIFACLDVALDSGYRGIDTASFYYNERRIGEALKILLPKHSLDRKQLFITSKLSPKFLGSSSTKESFSVSLEALRTTYLDLFLIHWPGLQQTSLKFERKDAKGQLSDLRRQSWQALEDLVMLESTELEENPQSSETVISGSGAYRHVRSLGVCNYLPRHLEELASYAKVPPAVIQCEYHPYFSVESVEHPIRRACTRLFPMIPIHFQAHSALAGGEASLLNHPTIVRIAELTQKLPSQVIIRWSIQKGNGVVVKSSVPRHIIENSRVFGWELSPEAMEQIDNLENRTRYCWDPNTVP